MIVTKIFSADGVKLLNAIQRLEKKSVAVGWFEKSHYDDGTQVATVAAQNEFGNPNKNIPARPFMRPTVIHDKKKWEKLTTDGAKKILKGELTIDNVLDLLGKQVTVDIKDTISKIYYPALAERTVLARIERSSKLSRIKGPIKNATLGSVTKPLIDTGVMFNTITHELRDE